MTENGNRSTGHRRFFVSAMDDGHQELIGSVARDEGAAIRRRRVGGVTFECDGRTAKRILRRAGRLAAERDALRGDALAYVLEKAGSCSPEGASEVRSRRQQLDEEDVVEWEVEESDAATTDAGAVAVSR